MPKRRSHTPTIDLHPSRWRKDWGPPIGNDPRPGEKPHIWQEFERDRDMSRAAGEPLLGRGWPVLAFIVLMIGLLTWLEVDAGPEWLVALRNLF